MTEVRLMTLDPGHFHAALVQKEMYSHVSRRVHVYAPLGPDLLAHLGRIASFNSRHEHPTAWELEVHTGPQPLERLLAERPGNVVVLSGRNRHKIDYLQAAVEAGLHVLADKPWIIVPADLPRLRAVLDRADAQGLIAYDIMTERHEITSLLQRELVNDPEVFGTIIAGSTEEPGVFMESKHYLMKLVAGVPNRRPVEFFDVHQQGEGLTDVGVHLVDLALWILFPDQAIDPERDVTVLAAQRWPTLLSREDFRKVTGEADFPNELAAMVRDDRLHYFCNTAVSCTLRGIHAKISPLWDFEAAPGTGDTHLAVFRGSRSRVEIRQGKEQGYRPELHVVPNRTADQAGLRSALQARVARWQDRFRGVALEEQAGCFRISIPDRYRIGHEAHFAQVAHQFLEYLRDPLRLPAWEKPIMQAKYRVTTEGVDLARRSP